jgi:IS30 family transposase
MYTQLTLEEREQLFCLYKKGMSLRAIRKILHRSDTTIGRELKRNRISRGGQYLFSSRYIPCRVHEKARKRGKTQRSQASWKGPQVLLYIKEHLMRGWSPEAIAGRMRIDHPLLSICHETIYRMIYEKQNKRYRLWTYLTLKRKKRMKKRGRTTHRESRLLGAVSITQRSAVVATRRQPGHWETDNIIGKISDDTALSVIVERTTRLTLLHKLKGRKATDKLNALFTRLSVFLKHLRKTLTTDNRAENASHEDVTRTLGMPVYFCHPYASWEKGSVENMNGRIRRYIPKKVSIDSIPHEDVQAIEWELNNTPRKCLGWRTPLEACEEIYHTI